MVEEYKALRNEVLERLDILQSQTINTRGFIFSLWGVGFGVIGFMLKDFPNSKEMAIFMGFVSALPFYISLLLLVPASLKCNENIIHIASISAYLRVFYECPSILSGKKEGFCNWEMGNGLVSMIFHGRKNQKTGRRKGKKKFQLCEVYNSEYMILGIASTLFYYLAFFIFIKLLLVAYDHVELSPLITLQVFLGFLLIACLHIIRDRSSVIKAMTTTTEIYIKDYLSLSVDLGVNRKEDLDSLWLRLDPNRPLTNHFEQNVKIKEDSL